MAEILYQGETYVTKSELKRRGWTDRLVRELVGNPDLLLPNLRDFPGTSSLWRLERIVAIEQSAAFCERQRAGWSVKLRAAVDAVAALSARDRRALGRLMEMEVAR